LLVLKDFILLILLLFLLLESRFEKDQTTAPIVLEFGRGGYLLGNFKNLMLLEFWLGLRQVEKEVEDGGDSL